MNSLKALQARNYQVENETLQALGIINKSGKKRIYKDRNRKRHLYQGFHQIPVFNLKYQDMPVMLTFKFMVYRTSIKIYIEAKLYPLPEQAKICYMVNKNRQLILELSERLAIKYMIQSENDFGILIDT